MSKKLSFQEFVERAIRVHGQYFYQETEYTNSHSKTLITCPVHGGFYQTPKKHIRGKQGCPLCARVRVGFKKRLSQEDFLAAIKMRHGEKYDFEDIAYKNHRTRVTVKCRVHENFKIKAGQLLRGEGCPKCGVETTSKKNTLEQKKVIEKFIQKHLGKYGYEKVSYEKMTLKVWITCPKHGDFKQTPSNHLNGHGCPKCRRSRGETEIARILTDNVIRFEEQKKFPGCRYKRLLTFDFYLPEYNICIEYDGIQHYNNAFRGRQTEYIQRNDKIKTEFCEQNSIGLFRIPYFTDTREMMTELLKKIKTI